MGERGGEEKGEQGQHMHLKALLKISPPQPHL